MPLTISSEATLEKNKLADSGAWILLLEVIYPDEPSIYLCYNNENITWDGNEWIAFPFTLGNMEENNTGETPSVTLSVNDIGRKLSPLLDDVDGGVGAEVWIRIVHSKHLDVADAELEEKFEILDVNIDSSNVINFKLGAENLSNYRSPPDRFLKSHCRYDEFGGTYCNASPLVVAATTCDRTFARCRELGNQARFGGFPGCGQLGLHE